jgi:hypothetical protein
MVLVDVDCFPCLIKRRSQGFKSGRLLFAKSLPLLFSSVHDHLSGVTLARCPGYHLSCSGSHTCSGSPSSGVSFVRGLTCLGIPLSGVHFQYRIQVIVSSPSLPCSAPQSRLYPLAAVAQISLPIPYSSFFFLSCLSPSIPDSLPCITGIRGIVPQKVEKSNARKRFQCIL